MSLKRGRSSSPSALAFFTSPAIEDRSSKFIAVYSPTASARALQSRAEFKSATHRIAAWRKPSSQLSLSSQVLHDIGNDDDGEKYGGKSLERLLVSMNVEGSLVVARWYGGVMLGPVRFDHIRNCAVDAIRQCREKSDNQAKKIKIETDQKEKERLVDVLQERDQSIVVLRGLLAEKLETLSSQDSKSAGRTKTPDYSIMPLPTLQKLETVRDRTIGWILKQIEKAGQVPNCGPEPRATPMKESYDASGLSERLEGQQSSDSGTTGAHNLEPGKAQDG
ncbi:hypothetical protein MMC21_000592 [Puttea exsequens]|nr:hypothetical protein [Puttea exsequens]